MTVRIAQVSDAHLSAARPFFAGNFARIAQAIRDEHFDYLLATGDLNLVGEQSAEELTHGIAQHAAIGPEMICVPGNHDVGNDPVRGGTGIATPERVARWTEHAGPSAWVRDLPGWRLIGLDCQSLDFHTEQWEVLARAVRDAGSSNHLGQELLFGLTGIDMQNVMYKTQAEMLPDLINGAHALSLVTLALSLPHIREGRLKALAISAPRRSPDLPNVPTIGEAGYPEAMFLPWFGLVAAAPAPRPVVRRLSDELQKALTHPEVVTRLEKMGTQITPMAAEEMDAFIAREGSRWANVIRQRNIKPLS